MTLSRHDLERFKPARRAWLNGHAEPVVLTGKKRVQREFHKQNLREHLAQLFNSIMIFGILSALVFHMLQASL